MQAMPAMQEETGVVRHTLRSAWAEATLALLLGAITLGSKSLWGDEIFSIHRANGSWDALYHSWRTADANMSFYDVVLHLWRGVGISGTGLRSLSVVAMAGSVLVVFAIGRRLFGAPCGLIAGLLLAIAPYAVRHAQEARSYALLVLLLSLATYAFIVGIEDPRWLPWAGYTVFGALAISAHYFAVLVLVAHAASLAFLERARVPWRLITLSGIALVVLALPAVWLGMNGRSGQLSWLRKPDLHGLFAPASFVVGGKALGFVFVLLLLCTARFAMAQWNRGGSGLERWRIALVFLWLMLPGALLLAFTFSVQPVYLDRYLIVSLPALMIAVALGITQLSRRWIIAALVILVALSTAKLVSWYRAPALEGAQAHPSEPARSSTDSP